MQDGRDNKGEKPTARPTGKPTGKSEAPSGHITVDGRGRNVWQWENENESTSILLKQLENDALALEPTRKVRKPDVGAAASQTSASPAGGVGKVSGDRDSTSREARGRIQQYPDRSGTKTRGRADSSQSPSKPSGPRRGGGGFDPYNNG